MFRFASVVAFVLSATSASADTVTPISLLDFFADSSVAVAPDGSTATLSEDFSFSSVILSNDPGLGDPNVIIPAANRYLSFDYNFMETGTSADDEFGVFLLDGTTGASLGSPFEHFFDSSSSGSISFNLTSLVGVGSTIGLQFQLSALFSDFSYDSTVSVSNLRLIDKMAIVPLPATGLLLMSGLTGFALTRRRTTV